MLETELPKRKNPRLKNYDYSRNGCYFVTFCVKDRKPVFCEIRQPDNELHQPIVELTDKGRIVDKYIKEYGKQVRKKITRFVHHRKKEHDNVADNDEEHKITYAKIGMSGAKTVNRCGKFFHIEPHCECIKIMLH